MRPVLVHPPLSHIHTLLCCTCCLSCHCLLQGAVLLHPSLQPQACSQFRAVLVLLGGQWPARGLLSGACLCSVLASQ